MYKRRFTSLLACVLWSAGTFQSVWAQESDSVRVLGSIDVVATREAGSLDEALARVDRLRLSAAAPGHSLRVLTLVPGLDIRQAGPSGAVMASLRGLGASSTRIELDGIRLIDPATGTFDLSILPASMLASARISSAISGGEASAASPGGTLSLDSDSRLPSGVTFGAGAFGTLDTDIRGTSATSDAVISGALSASRSAGDFRYPHPVHPTQAWARRLDSDKSSVSAFVSGNHTWPVRDITGSRSHPVKLGFVLLGTHVERGIPSLSNAQAPGARQRDRLVAGGVDLKAVVFDMPIGTAWSLTHSAFRFQPSTADSLENRVAEMAWSLDIKRLVSRSWMVRFASSLRRSGVESRQRHVVTGAEFQWSLARIGSRLETGLLVTSDVQKIRSEGTAEERPSIVMRQTVPSVHSTFRWSEEWHLSLAAGRIYRPPTLNERFWLPGGNPDLRAEHGWQSEAALGWHGATRGRPILIQLTVFHSRLSDRILWRPALAGSALHVWTAENVARVTGHGLELDLRWQPVRHWWLYAAASRIDQRDRSNPSAASWAKRLRYTASGSALIEMEYRRQDWGGFVSVHHTGRRFTASDESRWLPASTVIDLGMVMQFRMGSTSFRASGSLLNITDRIRESSPWMPMPGREWRLALSLTS